MRRSHFGRLGCRLAGTVAGRELACAGASPLDHAALVAECSSYAERPRTLRAAEEGHSLELQVVETVDKRYEFNESTVLDTNTRDMYYHLHTYTLCVWESPFSVDGDWLVLQVLIAWTGEHETVAVGRGGKIDTYFTRAS